MASYLWQSPSFALLCSFLLLLLVPISSAVGVIPLAGCAAKAFSRKCRYALYIGLPVLDSTLNWTHGAATSTLCLAFFALPDAPDGWVSWSINPTKATMLDTRSLIAFHGTGGAMDVGTYNISSYQVCKPQIDYEISKLEVEYGVDSRMTIFVAFRLPVGTAKLYHMWQVGPSVTNGVLDKHRFGPANMAAKGTLDLVTGDTSTSGNDSKLCKRNVRTQFSLLPSLSLSLSLSL